MGKLIDLTGQSFERWNVLERAPNKGKATMWKCKCGCGNIKDVESHSLINGLSKSCGCLHNELLVERCTKHNCAKQTWRERIYEIWLGMVKRCYNPKEQYFPIYGGRGIIVCDEWICKNNGSKNFIEWAKSHGYADDLEIDRVDPDGNYCPENCRWATKKVQANNRRTNHYIVYNGERHTMKEWAEIKGLPYGALSHRIYRGWDIECALNIPLKITRRET